MNEYDKEWKSLLAPLLLSTADCKKRGKISLLQANPTFQRYVTASFPGLFRLLYDIFFLSRV
jgi:hypothetical protein